LLSTVFSQDLGPATGADPVTNALEPRQIHAGQALVSTMSGPAGGERHQETGLGGRCPLYSMTSMILGLGRMNTASAVLGDGRRARACRRTSTTRSVFGAARAGVSEQALGAAPVARTVRRVQSGSCLPHTLTFTIRRQGAAESYVTGLRSKLAHRSLLRIPSSCVRQKRALLQRTVRREGSCGSRRLWSQRLSRKSGEGTADAPAGHAPRLCRHPGRSWRRMSRPSTIAFREPGQATLAGTSRAVARDCPLELGVVCGAEREIVLGVLRHPRASLQSCFISRPLHGFMDSMAAETTSSMLASSATR
jgi:hypothetical protein